MEVFWEHADRIGYDLHRSYPIISGPISAGMKDEPLFNNAPIRYTTSTKAHWSAEPSQNATNPVHDVHEQTLLGLPAFDAGLPYDIIIVDVR